MYDLTNWDQKGKWHFHSACLQIWMEWFLSHQQQELYQCWRYIFQQHVMMKIWKYSFHIPQILDSYLSFVTQDKHIQKQWFEKSHHDMAPNNIRIKEQSYLNVLKCTHLDNKTHIFGLQKIDDNIISFLMMQLVSCALTPFSFDVTTYEGV